MDASGGLATACSRQISRMWKMQDWHGRTAHWLSFHSHVPSEYRLPFAPFFMSSSPLAREALGALIFHVCGVSPSLAQSHLGSPAQDPMAKPS